MKNLFYVMLMSFGLVACQTTSVQIDPKEEEMVKQATLTHCVRQQTADGHAVSSKRMQAEPVEVFSITSRNDGWKAADIVSRGVRDSVYFHSETSKFICGSKNWAKYLEDPKSGGATRSAHIVSSEWQKKFLESIK